jgi:multidrug transporter EmrE-like cation transporter
MTASSFALIFLSVSMNAGAQIALRKAMLTLGAIPSISEPLAFLWTFVRNVYLWGGLSFYAVSILLWLAVLSSNQVSVAYPMLSIGYVIAALFSFLLLGEAIPPMRLAGIALICAGVVCVSRTA